MIRGAEMLKVQNLVIGAGVVGLAIAERLVRRQGPKASTWVLEKNASFGRSPAKKI